MLVYRLEDEMGVGPYQGAWKCYGNDPKALLYKDHNSYDYTGVPSVKNYKRATPTMEGFKVGEHDVCGCGSFASLQRWFEDHLKRLIRIGYRVVEYEVPASYVKITPTQVVFRIDKAKQLRIVLARRINRIGELEQYRPFFIRPKVTGQKTMAVA